MHSNERSMLFLKQWTINIKTIRIRAVKNDYRYIILGSRLHYISHGGDVSIKTATNILKVKYKNINALQLLSGRFLVLSIQRYYGNSGLSAAGTLTISGGTVTASGEGGAVTGPGIGSVGTCGNIVITGGNITATGFDDYGSSGSSGIGTGSGSSGGVCGTITITSGIERLVVTKASRAEAVIGKGNANSTVGTITIDGVENPTAESFFSELSLAVSNEGRTWTFTPATNVPTSLANLKDMINAGKDASAYLGRYVYLGGSIGTDATDAIGRVAAVSAQNEDAGGVADARMLVIALTDLLAGSMVSCDDAQTAASNAGLAISGAEQTQWRIPSYNMWHAMTMGLGNADFVRLCAEAEMVEGQYYWSTSRESNYPYRYYYIYTTSYDYGQYRYYYNYSDGDKVKSRACFAY